MAERKNPLYVAICPVCGDSRGVWHKSDRERRCRDCASRWHGQSRSRLYRIYCLMKSRCGHTKAFGRSKLRYADRGIRVCAEWLESFAAFAAWAHASGYQEHLTIDRVDNNGDYSPRNCQWITRAENSRRQPHVKSKAKITVPDVVAIRAASRSGETNTSIAARYGVDQSTVSRVLSRKRWADVEDG